MACNLERTNQIAIITFGSIAHNALSSALLDQLIHHITGLNDDPLLNAIVIRSEGDRTFCAGADLSELMNIQDVKSGVAFFYKFAQLILAIRKSPHLVLCRVQGKAIGGAVGVIAASDFVIASEYAQVRLSELINGIGPFVVGPAIERKMGIASFQEMALSPALWQDASYSHHHGLFNMITADSQALDLAVENKINEWSAYSTQAMREIKRMLWSTTPAWDDLLKLRADISGRLIVSEEARAALSKLRKE